MSLVVEALILAVVGAVLCCLAALQLRPVIQLVRRGTRRVREIEPGPVEVMGTIRAGDGQPFLAASGTPFVAGVALGEEVGRKGARRLLERRAQFVRATVDDAGDLCEVDLEGAELLAEAWEKRDGSIVHTELVVPDGAFVVVSGVARVEGGAAYRGPERRVVVRGTPDHPLVVSVGGEWSAIVRTTAGRWWRSPAGSFSRCSRRPRWPPTSGSPRSHADRRGPAVHDLSTRPSC